MDLEKEEKSLENDLKKEKDLLKKDEIERELLVQEHSKKIQSLNQLAVITNKTAQKELSDAR